MRIKSNSKLKLLKRFQVHHSIVAALIRKEEQCVYETSSDSYKRQVQIPYRQRTNQALLFIFNQDYFPIHPTKDEKVEKRE